MYIGKNENINYFYCVASHLNVVNFCNYLKKKFSKTDYELLH